MSMSFIQITLTKEDVSNIKSEVAKSNFGEIKKGSIVAWLESNVDRWGKLILSSELVSAIQSQESKQNVTEGAVGPFLQSILHKYTKLLNT